ncbi:hypothetical protein [Paenibacillus shenyangensis]|uniref:hypothetical protein n=1 Tax=Paenibacillus sp. A9 TaxID=1284352 RepID=UPI00036DE045|nr:hypothetical protein [Paenibacillus sp. A9]
MGVEQLQWLPEATEEEFQAAKSLLRRYRYMSRAAAGLKDLEDLTIKQQCKLREYSDKTANIELAVALILDQGVQEITEFVFLKGNDRQAALNKLRFLTERSVDRKIRRGVISVANTLKDWEII